VFGLSERYCVRAIHGCFCGSGRFDFGRFAQEFSEGNRYGDLEHEGEYQEAQPEDAGAGSTFEIRLPSCGQATVQETEKGKLGHPLLF
jgi:hypothetical protein